MQALFWSIVTVDGGQNLNSDLMLRTIHNGLPENRQRNFVYIAIP